MRAVHGLVLAILGGLFLMGFTVNGTAPGSVGAMAPVAPTNTAAPMMMMGCSTTRTNFRVDNKGTANCYMAPASIASPCGVASPAPNAGTGAGIWLAPQGTWIFSTQGIYSGTNNQAGAEWDVVCDATGNKLYYTEMP